jgi:hypothetical protein
MLRSIVRPAKPRIARPTSRVRPPRLDSLPTPEARPFGAPVTGNDRRPPPSPAHAPSTRRDPYRALPRRHGSRGALCPRPRSDCRLGRRALYMQFRCLVDNLVSTRGLEPPGLDDPQPFTSSAPDSIDLACIGSLIFPAGFRPDYRSWLPWPDAFDAWGFPLHKTARAPWFPGCTSSGPLLAQAEILAADWCR